MNYKPEAISYTHNLDVLKIPRFSNEDYQGQRDE